MRILLLNFCVLDDFGILALDAYMRGKGHEIKIAVLDYQRTEKNEYERYPTSEEVASISQIEDGAFIKKFVYNNDLFFTPKKIRALSDNEIQLLSGMIEQWEPQIVAYGVRQMYHEYLPTLIPRLRKAFPEIVLVAGGHGPTLDPGFSLNLGVDAVIRGEGEYAFAEFATAVERGEDWRNIRNVA